MKDYKTSNTLFLECNLYVGKHSSFRIVDEQLSLGFNL